ncbi:MAG: SRPBCC family protein [Spirochaetia bacterium]|jgi:hypothetical protein|nr:SRPBCC family protein [Spirochaetia bacterium]
MKIQVKISISDTKENVWKVITDIEGSVNTIKGIEKIEILEKDGDATDLTMSFNGEFVTFKAKLMSIMGILFLSATKKALKEDLNDIKIAVEAN